MTLWLASPPREELCERAAVLGRREPLGWRDGLATGDRPLPSRLSVTLGWLHPDLGLHPAPPPVLPPLHPCLAPQARRPRPCSAGLPGQLVPSASPCLSAPSSETRPSGPVLPATTLTWDSPGSTHLTPAGGRSPCLQPFAPTPTPGAAPPAWRGGFCDGSGRGSGRPAPRRAGAPLRADTGLCPGLLAGPVRHRHLRAGCALGPLPLPLQGSSLRWVLAPGGGCRSSGRARGCTPLPGASWQRPGPRHSAWGSPMAPAVPLPARPHGGSVPPPRPQPSRLSAFPCGSWSGP